MDRVETSLGFPLIKSTDAWEIDLTHLKIFTGLSVLSRIIGDQIIEMVENHPGDVSFLYKINPNINPELVEMDISHIQVYARAGVLNDILCFIDEFREHLITVFGTFQRTSWGQKIHPEYYEKGESPAPSKALVFPFHHACVNDKIDYQFILERAKNLPAKGGFFFRLSIETHQKAILDLKTIPHVIVDDFKTRVYISGSTKIAESIRDGILNGCTRGVKVYSEENRGYSHLFDQLAHTRLGRMERINFFWEKEFSGHIQKVAPDKRISFFKTIFLSLEAGSICGILINSETVKIKLGKLFFCLYLSQLGRVLNISINLPRKIFYPDHYLNKMPTLKALSLKHEHDLDFSGTRIFLIHHITSEIIAFIEALKKLNAESVTVLFVKYGGVVPSAYLDALLEHSSDFLFMAGLTRKMAGNNRGYYTLASNFSDVSGFEELGGLLEKKQLDYFESMKLVAGHFFLKSCAQAITDGKKMLLIEDGGYLSPLLNRFALSGTPAKEVFQQYHVDDATPEGAFSSWLKPVMTGAVEHTKNGYDRIALLKTEYSRLFFPVYSIAVSKIKTIEESQEVAHSILSAIESILHENGMVLSKRKILLLGAEGNIGKCLSHFLINGRLHETNKTILQVDISYTGSDAPSRYPSIDAIPDSLLRQTDLFIGVVGKSILKRNHLENIILNGDKKKLIFASGSTKTLEFEDLSQWLYAVSGMADPKIGDTSVQIEFDRIYDPQSGIDQGGKVSLKFQKDGLEVEKELYLLGDLSPVNFLFYGVPTETMDVVLSQLLTVSLGMSRQYKENRLPAPDLYAVDEQIDEWGNLIVGNGE